MKLATRMGEKAEPLLLLFRIPPLREDHQHTLRDCGAREPHGHWLPAAERHCFETLAGSGDAPGHVSGSITPLIELVHHSPPNKSTYLLCVLSCLCLAPCPALVLP